MIDVMGLKDKTGDFTTLEFELLSTGDVQVSIVDRSEILVTEISVVVGLDNLDHIVAMLLANNGAKNE